MSPWETLASTRDLLSLDLCVAIYTGSSSSSSTLFPRGFVGELQWNDIVAIVIVPVKSIGH